MSTKLRSLRFLLIAAAPVAAIVADQLGASASGIGGWK